MSESLHEYESLVAALEADKEAYLEVVYQAALIADNYAGTEAEYDALFDTLKKVESFAEKHKLILPGASIVEKEKALAKKWQFTEVPLTVSDFLAASSDSLEQRIEQKISQILWHKITKTILPPGDGELKSSQGQGSEDIEPRFEPRLKELVMILQEIGVFTDDLIITTGQNSPTMVRQKSYAVVEIPRLSRTVLVCDQVGEATFVIEGNFSQETFLTLSKDELQNTYPDLVHKITRDNYANWKEQLLLYLSPKNTGSSIDTDQQKRKIKKEGKINIAEYDVYRQKMQADFTPETWVKCATHEGVEKFKINEKGLKALLTLFKVPGDYQITIINFLRLGLIIWGQDEPSIKAALDTYLDKNPIVVFRESRTPEERAIIERRSLEEWRVEIINAGWTPEKWLEYANEQKLNNFPNIDGKAVYALCTIFGVTGVKNTVETFLRLGLAIWGEDCEPIKKILEIEKRTPDQWREAIKKAGWTPEKWVDLAKKQNHIGFKIDEKGVQVLSTVFGIAGRPTALTTFLRLGLSIWEHDGEVIRIALEEHLDKHKKFALRDSYGPEKLAEMKTRTLDQWREAIKKAGWTPEKWVQVNSDSKVSAFEIEGVGMRKLCTIFGVKDQAKSVSNFFYLGLIIWGEDTETIKIALDKYLAEKRQASQRKVVYTQEELAELKKRTLEDWREAIKKAGWTPEKWVEHANAASIRSFNLDGKAIGGLYLIFKVPLFNDNPHYIGNYLRLGLSIFGQDCEPIKKVLEAYQAKIK